ncbi:MAG TPA: ABC transporter ATP-binding protein [Iamia sp.]|jgi:ABC-2 type transport system ATP-binding protein|nr:ABC transporter ATP-binding protein [Iamia sp.]
MDGGVITCRGLARRFPGGRAITGIDLDVQRGEVLALLGPNGAGKTTTVRLLNGVLAPDEGTATVLGLDPWRQGDDLRRRTAVLTEHAGLDDRFTARENLRLAGRVRGLDPRATERRAAELLERLGMGDRADVVVRGFSTGERKRIALARALLHDPDLLFLDEPTSGLDPTAGRRVTEMIAELATTQGRTVVLCTHLLAEAGRLADRMAVLVEGRMRASGSPAAIAGELWGTRTTTVDLGRVADAQHIVAVAAVTGTSAVEGVARGLRFEGADRAVVPAAVAALVGVGAEVFGVDTHEPSLADVYFAVEGAEAVELPEVTR